MASAIKADTPEKLWEVAPLWLEHCGDSMKYVNDMLGSVAMGLINVTQGEDGEWLFALNDAGMGVGKELQENQDDIDQGELCDVHYWQTKAQREWQELTDEDWEHIDNKKKTSLDTFAHGAAWAADQLKERNK